MQGREGRTSASGRGKGGLKGGWRRGQEIGCDASRRELWSLVASNSADGLIHLDNGARRGVEGMLELLVLVRETGDGRCERVRFADLYDKLGDLAVGVVVESVLSATHPSREVEQGRVVGGRQRAGRGRAGADSGDCPAFELFSQPSTLKVNSKRTHMTSDDSIPSASGRAPTTFADVSPTKARETTR